MEGGSAMMADRYGSIEQPCERIKLIKAARDMLDRLPVDIAINTNSLSAGARDEEIFRDLVESMKRRGAL